MIITNPFGQSEAVEVSWKRDFGKNEIDLSLRFENLAGISGRDSFYDDVPALA